VIYDLNLNRITLNLTLYKPALHVIPCHCTFDKVRRTVDIVKATSHKLPSLRVPSQIRGEQVVPEGVLGRKLHEDPRVQCCVVVGIDGQGTEGLKPDLEHVLDADIMHCRLDDQVPEFTGLDNMRERCFLYFIIG
jgi:hypothetical protein